MSDKFNWIGRKGDTVTLKALREFPFNTIAKNPGKAAVLDVETTGLSSETDQIIEIGVIIFEYDKDTKKITRILEEISELQESISPLRQKIIDITGITDDDLKGQTIDWNLFEEKMKGVEFIIAHNAAFDRGFMDQVSQFCREAKWCCSLNDILWADNGYPILKLDTLAIYHGFFNDNAHRASDDCKALLYLLTFNDYMSEMIKASESTNHLVFAKGTKFSTKLTFNDMEYKWSANPKLWYKLYRDKDDAEEGKDKLIKNVYDNKINLNNCDIVKVPPVYRYKSIDIILKGDPMLKESSAYKFSRELILTASNLNHDTKDLLKERGYFYSPTSKASFCYINEADLEEEKNWLKENVYRGSFKGKVIKNPHNSK
jgi:DNA polymerase III subunit epsilon